VSNLLTGLDKLIADIAGPLVFSAASLRRVARVSDGRGGWTETEAAEVCQALVTDYSAYAKGSLGIPDTDRKILLLGHGLTLPPQPGNIIVIEAYRWVIVQTMRDPAKAVYECQSRPSGAQA
jgi:hypothetical protein